MDDREATTGTNYSIEAVDCAIDVLFTVARQADLGVTQAARQVGGSKQRIYRMLRTLEARGLLRRSEDGKSYRLGYQALILGRAADQQIDLIRIIDPILARLGEKANETVQLRILEQREAVCISYWEPTRDLRVYTQIGRRNPLHAGAGKVFLAHMPASEREAILSSPLESYTPNTLTDRAALEQRLDEIRREGVCVSKGEIGSDLVSVSAPIFGPDSTIQATVHIAAPASRASPQMIEGNRHAVMDAAREASRLLGHPARRIAK